MCQANCAKEHWPNSRGRNGRQGGCFERIDVFATAIAAKMTVEDIGDLD